MLFLCIFDTLSAWFKLWGLNGWVGIEFVNKFHRLAYPPLHSFCMPIWIESTIHICEIFLTYKNPASYSTFLDLNQPLCYKACLTNLGLVLSRLLRDTLEFWVLPLFLITMRCVLHMELWTGTYINGRCEEDSLEDKLGIIATNSKYFYTLKKDYHDDHKKQN